MLLFPKNNGFPSTVGKGEEIGGMENITLGTLIRREIKYILTHGGKKRDKCSI